MKCCTGNHVHSGLNWYIWYSLVGFEPWTTEFGSDALTDWTIRPWVQLALRAKFVQLLLFHLSVQFSHFMLAVALVSYHICFMQNLAEIIMFAAEWIDTDGIQHWRIFRSSYGNLAWVGFEPMRNKIHSGALTNWVIKPWVEFTLRAIFLQLLSFHLFVQCSHFVSTFTFVSCRICFKQNLSQVITLGVEWLNTYGIPHNRFVEVAIGRWPG